MTPAVGGKTVEVRVSGDLTLGPQLRRFAEKLAERMTAGRAHALLLDLSALGNIDSAGLGELVILHTTGAEHHCRVALVGTPARVVTLLVTTRLDGLLPRYDSMEAARAANA